MSVSLRADEVNAIPDYIEKHPSFKTRHEVIKFAIRRLLFPDEKTVPLNGRKATIHPAETHELNMHGHVTRHVYPEHVTIDGKPILKAERKSILKKESEKDNEKVEGVSTE